MRVTERTLYRPIMNHLRRLSCSSVDEVSSNGYPDIVFTKDKVGVVLQVKIGEINLLDGVAEVERHARELGYENKVVIAYPESVRREIEQPDQDLIEQLALDEVVKAISLTEFLTDRIEGSGAEVLERIVNSIDVGEAEYHPETAVQTLREGIERLVMAIRYSSEDYHPILNAVTGHFELFTALGQEAADVDEDQLNTAGLDLAAYILINQMLFYRMYSRMTDRVKPFKTVYSPEELVDYFAQIEEIDYAPIYSVDVLSQIPSTPIIGTALWDVSDAIIGLRPELMRHDLIGRLFHELLPPDTRKLLAAFYTRPVAAEILAELSIDDGTEKVADLACGSGTLLVSAYAVKRRLLGRRNPRLHRQFVEKDLTGIDIMPFAAHLAALNLAAQNLRARTDRVRVGCQDSLELAPGDIVKPFRFQLAMEWGRDRAELVADDGREKIIEAVSLADDAVNEAFEVGYQDTILMNPPFTKWKRLPKEFRGAVRKKWGALFHTAAGLWAPFMLLGDRMLADEGKLGLVIPMNFLRGERTNQLREYFLNGRHTWRYVVKAVNNYGFTEGAEYRDILLVLQKKPPRRGAMTGVVLIKVALDELNLYEAQEIATQIRRVKEGSDESHEAFDIYWVEHEEVQQHSEHLQHLVAASNIHSRKLLLDFISECSNNVETQKLPASFFSEGYRPVPRGTSDFVFITRPVEESRLEKVRLIIRDEGKDYVCAVVKDLDWPYRFRRSKLIASLRSTTGLPCMDITGLHDYAIIEAYEDLDRLLAISNFRGSKDEIDWQSIRRSLDKVQTNLVVQHRINPYSPTTRFFAFYSDFPICPSNVSEVVNARGPKEAKALCVLFNSTYFWAQFFFTKEESTGRWLNIRVADLTQIEFPTISSLSEEQITPLLSVFEELGRKHFPSLMEQLETGYEGRLAIDHAVLECLGVTTVSDDDLRSIYEVLYDEMSKIRRLKKD